MVRNGTSRRLWRWDAYARNHSASTSIATSTSFSTSLRPSDYSPDSDLEDSYLGATASLAKHTGAFKFLLAYTLSRHQVTIPFDTAARGGSLSLDVGGRQIDVRIPPGVSDGQTMRLAGQGPDGEDLFIKLRIGPHPYFKREGNDVILEVPLTVSEAALGTTVEVPTPDGSRLGVKVPPGTSSGARLRLRGRGIKGGDQYIEIKVVVPPAKDERSRQLMEEFARLHPLNPRAGLPWS